MLLRILKTIGHTLLTAATVILLLIGGAYLHAQAVSGDQGPDNNWPIYTQIFSKMLFGEPNHSIQESITEADNSENIFRLRGNVGIGTTNPGSKLDVVGGDINIDAGQSIYSRGRMNIGGEENLYLLNKGGVNVSNEWGGNGNLNVDGDVCTSAGKCLNSVSGGGIKGHEIKSRYGRGVTVSCSPGKIVLGCGYRDGKVGHEAWPKVYPNSTSSCHCYNYFGVTCYAICAYPG